MLKPKTLDIAESNIANLGTELEKKVKLAAAKTEKQWEGAGLKPGLQAWRIENFKVVPWKDIGEFYSGDSYIVLRTYKKTPESNALSWDVHFWLGLSTTQDEAGTAAYKTVELDDVLGGAPVQHREVEGHESQLFLSYFKQTGGIKILEGGVESGFKHVKPQEFIPRLLWIKGRNNIRIVQVELTAKKLNSGDVFILDAGMHLFQWNGSGSNPREKQRAARLIKAISDERGGKPEIIVQEQDHEEQEFWKILGGKVPVAAADSVELDEAWEEGGTQLLFRLSDKPGQLDFTLEAKGKLARDQLDTTDAFLLDVSNQLFVWVGKQASISESRKALQYAQLYITRNKLPVWLPISRILEGGENEIFESYFAIEASTSKEAAAPSGKTEKEPEAHPPRNWNAKADAELLRKALKSFLTNDKQLIAILGARDYAHLQEVGKEYVKLYTTPLPAAVKSQTRFDFGRLCRYLVTPVIDYKCEELYRAMKGLGTSETALIDVLTLSTNDELKKMNKVYADTYTNGLYNPNKLADDIKGDTSFNFKRVLLKLWEGTRDEGDKPNPGEAEKDAEILYKNGEARLGTDDTTFVNLISSRSRQHMLLVDKAYQNKYGKTLEEMIRSETSGFYMKTLIALCTPNDVYWAKRAHEAMDRLGTSDSTLMRLFLFNTISQVNAIKKAYETLYSKTLAEDITAETSGNFRKLLLALLQPR